MKKQFFINLSNHTTDKWSDSQRAAALDMAEVLHNIPFPNINPSASSDEVSALVFEYFQKVLDLIGDDETVIHVAGEATFVHAFVRWCQRHAIKCVTATSERKAVEKSMPDGTTQKISDFFFVQFRDFF